MSLTSLMTAGCGPDEQVIGRQGTAPADTPALADAAPADDAASASAPEVVAPAQGDASRVGGHRRGSTPVAEASPDPPRKGFVVHEWGTFTSVQGSDGETLDGLHHEEEALPDFVHGRARWSKSQKQMEYLPEPCNQKMETPVVYFHTPTPLDVTLKVDFPQGIISQWYPAAASFAPPIGSLKGSWAHEPGQLAGGTMTWQVRVDPDRSMEHAPKVSADSVWAPSRFVWAAPVRSVLGKKHSRFKKPLDETERFIFYRGLGRFTLPMRITAAGGRKLIVRNLGDKPVPYVVVLHTKKGGEGGVAVYGGIDAGTHRSMPIPAAKLSPTKAKSAAKSALAQGLVAAGLYKDEARAMVRTWQKSWFATPGVRVLYVLPSAWTEALLPMKVSPPPESLVRVLVGRIEVLTPEDESKVMQVVKRAAVEDTHYDKLPIDRFTEPRVRRACALLGAEVASWCKQAVNGLEGPM